MAEWRAAGSPCPLDEEAAGLSKCPACRYFRGASSFHELKILCNWPRDGSYIAVREPLPRWMEVVETEPET